MDLVRVWEQIMRMKEMSFLLMSGRNGQEMLLRNARAVLPFDSAQTHGAFSRKGKI